MVPGAPGPQVGAAELAWPATRARNKTAAWIHRRPAVAVWEAAVGPAPAVGVAAAPLAVAARAGARPPN